jgi:hypothetical protein
MPTTNAYSSYVANIRENSSYRSLKNWKKSAIVMGEERAKEYLHVQLLCIGVEMGMNRRSTPTGMHNLCLFKSEIEGTVSGVVIVVASHSVRFQNFFNSRISGFVIDPKHRR